MKTIGELYTFYKEALVPKLKEIDKKRIITLVEICIVSIITAVLLAWLFMILNGDGELDKSDGKLLTFIAVVGISICGIIRASYSSKFKVEIIREIAEFMDDSFTYSSERKVDSLSLGKCDLFNFEDASGEDLITGKTNQNIEFEYSSIKLEKGSGKNKRTVFLGSFFSADFNKNFSGKTVVLPDFAEKRFGAVGKWMQSMNRSNGELVKLEDPEFEKMFAVYGSDQIEARYILTPGMMRRIIDFAKKMDKKIFVSFVDSKMYIAISNGQGLFEPRLLKSIVNFDDIQKYYENFKFVLDIVDEFSLNTQLWKNNITEDLSL